MVPGRPISYRLRPAALVATIVGLATGCQGDPSSSAPPFESDSVCSIPEAQIFDGGPGKDGIPALTNPIMARAGEQAGSYLSPDHRVIGIVLDGQAIAIPHAIGWWHEIVNLDVGSRKVAVTYCPLTGPRSPDRSPWVSHYLHSLPGSAGGRSCR